MELNIHDVILLHYAIDVAIQANEDLTKSTGNVMFLKWNDAMKRLQVRLAEESNGCLK